jgi:hypothetical protein
MVGGIAVSTLLTLFVVPAAYSVIDDVVVWNAERRKSGEGLLSGLATAWSRRRRASSLEAS